MKEFRINNQELKKYLKDDIGINLQNMTATEEEKLLLKVKSYNILLPVPNKVINHIFSLSSNYQKMMIGEKYKKNFLIKLYHMIYQHKIYSNSHELHGKCGSVTKEYLLSFVKYDSSYNYKLLEAYIRDFNDKANIYTKDDLKSVLEVLKQFEDRLFTIFSGIQNNKEISECDYTFLTCIPYQQLFKKFKNLREIKTYSFEKETVQNNIREIEYILTKYMK